MTPNVPDCDGVPWNTPPTKSMPVGSAPERVHARGARPPVVAMAWLYEDPAVEVARLTVDMARGASTLIESVRVEEPPSLPRTFTVNVHVPTAAEAGVPEIAPVDADRVSPVGRLPEAIDQT